MHSVEPYGLARESGRDDFGYDLMSSGLYQTES